MIGRQHVGVFHRTCVGLVGVGRDVDFTLAQQLPVVALRRAVIQTVFVHSHGAIGTDHRLVVAVAWQQSHTTGRRAVAPGLARVGGEVVGFVGDAQRAVVTGRLEGHVVAHGLELVFSPGFYRRRVGHGQVAGIGTAPANAAVGQHGGQVTGFFFGPGTGRQLVVPQRFHAVFRNRERHLSQPFKAHAIIDQLGVQGVVHDPLAHVIRVAVVTVTGVDVHLVGGRITLEQRLLAFGQFVFVLGHVLRGNHQNRLLRSVGVNRLVAGKLHMVPTRHFAQVLAGIRRDGARGVTRLLCPYTGQLLAQFGRFCGRYLSRCRADGDHVDGHGGCEHYACSCYFHVLPPTRIRLAGGVHPFFANQRRAHRPQRLLRPLPAVP